MPALHEIEGQIEPPQFRELPFPPVTKQHILNCSYENWYKKYNKLAITSKIIPLTQPFLEYLREDGLWLPDDDTQPYEETPWSPQNAHKTPDPTFEDNARPNDAARFADVHQAILAAINELGGSVVPKLNWSSPKDALHMALTKNSMECKTPNDIYLLLKSSIFVTHDLEHAFDDAVDASPKHLAESNIRHILVLRPYLRIKSEYEFRCFVKNRTVVGISQRDLRYIAYTTDLIDALRTKIQRFFAKNLKHSFPDPNFTFDVYVPEPHEVVTLVDINLWAPRTDPLLFQWLDILTTQTTDLLLGTADSSSTPTSPLLSSDEDTEEESFREIQKDQHQAEFKIVLKDDPEARNFGGLSYSAHKLPKDVVDAGMEGGEAMRELMRQWERAMAEQNSSEAREEDANDD